MGNMIVHETHKSAGKGQLRPKYGHMRGPQPRPFVQAQPAHAAASVVLSAGDNGSSVVQPVACGLSEGQNLNPCFGRANGVAHSWVLCS